MGESGHLGVPGLEDGRSLGSPAARDRNVIKARDELVVLAKDAFGRDAAPRLACQAWLLR